MIATETLSGPETEGAEQPQIHFPTGLVGYPSAQWFVLDQGDGGVFELRGVDDDDPDFVVVAPAPFFPDYAPVIDDETANKLGLRSQEDALVLLVVTLRELPEDASANTLAPLIINARTRDALQVVLTGQPFSLRQPLLAH
ncbi:MAG: flagellar assembly factor FliW [Actinomycetota bacterium]|nr:flagellar assembly factor FliW [Actinomycetota bacterium]